MSPHSTPCRALVVAIGLLAALTACAHRRQTPITPRAGAAQVPTASPAIRGLDHGLELWWWIVADPRPAPPLAEAPQEEAAAPEAPQPENAGEAKPKAQPKQPPVRYTIRDERITLPAALRPFLDRPVPLSPELRQRWRTWGLRVVSVPPEALPRIERSIRTVGPVHRQWHGEIPEWTDLVNGPQFEAGPMTGEEGVVMLDSGRFRLLGRCWSVPSADDGGGAALRLELLPQHQPRLSDSQRFTAQFEPPRPIERQGANYTSLAMALSLSSTDALVIVAEEPGANWNEDPAPEAQGAVSYPLTVPTLGERMLSTPATETTPRTRAVIVLLPHPRERFSLLP
jgi:hypothetical protein